MMQAFVPDMVEGGDGHVVNMCSVAGKTGTAKNPGFVSAGMFEDGTVPFR